MAFAGAGAEISANKFMYPALMRGGISAAVF